MILAVEGSWWARYMPLTYAIPILNVIYLITCKRKREKALGIFLIILLLLNVSLIAYGNLNIYLHINKKLKECNQKLINQIEKGLEIDVEKAIVSLLGNPEAEGLKYNVFDLIDKYKNKN